MNNFYVECSLKAIFLLLPSLSLFLSLLRRILFHTQETEIKRTRHSLGSRSILLDFPPLQLYTETWWTSLDVRLLDQASGNSQPSWPDWSCSSFLVSIYVMPTFSCSYDFVIYPDVDQTQGDSACLICIFINPTVIKAPTVFVYNGFSPYLP